MKVSYIQFRPALGNKKRNVRHILFLLEEVLKDEVDLVVLPELCNTGYVFRSKNDLKKLAEEIPEGITIKALYDFSKERSVNIVAGLPEKDGRRIYNTAVLVGPEGLIGKYRKAHLFGREKLFFSKGTMPFSVYNISKSRIGMMICFDWFFPEVARILALKGAEIICHPSNLVLPYCQKALLGTAIQNRVFIITANRIGTECGISSREIAKLLIQIFRSVIRRAIINHNDLKIFICLSQN